MVVLVFFTIYFILSGNLLAYISTYYTQLNSGIPNVVWSTLEYKKVNLAESGSLLNCMALCYFDPELNCKVLAFEPPVCYLGNPGANGTITTTDGTATLFATDGMYANVLKLVKSY